MASRPYPDIRRGVWLLKYRPDPTGPWIRITLGKDPRLKGPRPPRTPPQAILDRAHDLAEIEYRARHGMATAPARAKALAGYVDAYIEAFAGSHKPGSVKQLRRHAGRFVAFCAERGVSTVQGVTRPICRDYLEWRIVQVSHDTLKTEMRYLAPIWTRAVDEDGLMARNPWSRLKVPGKSTRSAPVCWTEDEVTRIVAAAPKVWHRDLILVLVNTGLRISTTLAMRWKWINWETGVITIPKEEAVTHAGVKTAYPVGMNRTSRDVLQRRRFADEAGEDGLVFSNPYRGGGAIPYDTARAAIERAIIRSGVKPGTPHDFRHTYARFIARAMPANVVQSQLGHSAAATTAIYTDLAAEDVAKALEDFGIGDTRPPDPGPDRPPA